MALSSICCRTLEPGRREIRILTVDPGDLNDDNICDLTTMSLGAGGCDTFNVLSEGWGAARQRRPIMLDGVPRTSIRRLRILHISPVLNRQGTVSDGWFRLWVSPMCPELRTGTRRHVLTTRIGLRDCSQGTPRYLIVYGEKLRVLVVCSSFAQSDSIVHF